MSQQDRTLIKQTLLNFFDAFNQLDKKLVMKSFHKNATLYHISPQGELKQTDITTWVNQFDLIKNNPDHPYNKELAKKNICYIDLCPQAASVKAEWIFSKFKYIHYYHLLKLNGQWLIVNKTWHTELIYK